MSETNAPVMDFLLHRRSTPPKMLEEPAPGREALMPILTAGLRSPDHGKLEPWRLMVLEKPALERLAALAAMRAPHLDVPEEKVAKGVSQYAESPLAVAVIFSPKVSEKVPEVEQLYSAGAVCLGVLNAALASGWGACWLTGWAVNDRTFLSQGLGLEAQESVAGMIFIGTQRRRPPERPRPDPAAIIQWVES